MKGMKRRSWLKRICYGHWRSFAILASDYICIAFGALHIEGSAKRRPRVYNAAVVMVKGCSIEIVASGVNGADSDKSISI